MTTTDFTTEEEFFAMLENKDDYVLTLEAKDLQQWIKKIEQKAKQEVIKDIPHTWLDPLFNQAVGKLSFTPKDVEGLFMALRKRLEDTHLSPVSSTAKPCLHCTGKGKVRINMAMGTEAECNQCNGRGYL